MSHTITVTSVDRDEEPDIVYRDATGRMSTFPWSGQTLLCGSLEKWDQPPEPMTAAERERVLDDLATWAFGDGTKPSGITYLAGPGRVPLRLPGPFGFRIYARGYVEARSGIVAMEPGRHLIVLGDERSRADGRPQLSVYLDTATAWQPSGAAPTPEELATIAARLPTFADVEVTAFASRRECDLWSLAYDLEDGSSRSFAGVGADAETIAAVCNRERAPPPGWFWQVELPCIYEAGRTGWNLEGERFAIGPINITANMELRARWQATPPATTLLLRAPTKPSAAELLVLADGNLRFFTSFRAIVLLAGQDAALTALAHEAVALAQQLAATPSATTSSGDTTSDLLLTADGARSLPPSPELRQLGDRLLAGLLDHMVPLR